MTTTYFTAGRRVASDDMNAHDALVADLDVLCMTRAGMKVHGAYVGSTVTHCGIRLGVSAERNRIRGRQVTSEHVLCDRCRIDARMSS